MPQALRQQVGWALVVLFGAIVVGGEGLHLLPGLNHSCYHSGIHRFDLASIDPGYCCATHQDHCSTAAAQRHAPCANHHQHTAPEAPQLRSVHDCPICKFFAQAKAEPPQAPPVGDIFSVLSAASSVGEFADATFARAYDSRGPPRACCI